jgi:hypothetical protein
LRDVDLIVLLNKVDILKNKLKVDPLRSHFSTFQGKVFLNILLSLELTFYDSDRRKSHLSKCRMSNVTDGLDASSYRSMKQDVS